MKKLILLLLFGTASYAQAEYEKIAITENVISTIAQFVNVQENNGVVNKINKGDLIDYLEYDSAANLPVTGVAAKLYLTRDDNSVYRWNGTLYARVSRFIFDANQQMKGILRLAGDLGGTADSPTVPSKANIASPTFTGIPSAPTAAAGTNTTQIASTAFVNITNGFNSASISYVEVNGNDATGQVGNPRKSYLTINAALDALPLTGGVIKIGVGTFNSPLLAKIKDNVKFIGSGKPMTDMVITFVDEISKPNITSPTKLLGGTILNGTFDFSLKNNIEMQNLGIDVGKTWVDAFNNGIATEGLVTAQLISHPNNNTSPPTKGIIVNNVSTLNYSALAATHSLLIENTIDAKITNISTYFGTHGLVVKSQGTNVNNVEAYGHSGEGLIVKADSYAYCSDVNINNIFITSIGAYDGGGMLIDGGSGILQRVNISNVNVKFTKYGISSTTGTTKNINFENINIFKTQGNGFYLGESVSFVNISNITQNGTVSGNGIEMRSTGNDIKIISNAHTSNSLGNGFYLYTSAGGKIIVKNIASISDDIGVRIVGNVYGSDVHTNSSVTSSIIGSLIFLPNSSGNSIAAIDTNGNITKSTILQSNVVSGAGTPNLLTKWTPSGIGNSRIVEDDSNLVLPIAANNGYIAIVAGASLANGLPRIELTGTTFSDPNKVALRANSIVFTAAEGATPYAELTGSGLKINNLAGTGSRVVTADNTGKLFATTGAVVTGSGTASYFPVWTSSGVIENSFMLSEGRSQLYISGNISAKIPVYASDAAADADTALIAKSFYKITGSRVIYQKP